MLDNAIGNVTEGAVPEVRSMTSQLELLKVVAELNHEMIFDYYSDTKVACLYEVQNGRFVVTHSRDGICLDNWEAILEQIFEEDVPAVIKCAEGLHAKPSQNVLDIRFLPDDGEYKWYRIFVVSEILDKSDKVNHIAGRIVCVDQEKQINEMNRKKAELDALTGVYNHKTFESIAETKLVRHKSETIFIMLDIDDFKMVNDTQGHYVGDMVISQTGAILSKMVKNRGIAGRLGGDEFAALVWSFKSEEEIRQFMQNLKEELKTIIFDMEYSASIGVCIRHGRNMTFRDMYYEADQGAYFAKKNGKNRIVFFEDIDVTEDYHEDLEQEMKIVDDEIRSLDEMSEMIFIGDEETHRIMHVNREALGFFSMTREAFIESATIEQILGMDEEETNNFRKEEYWFLIDTFKQTNEFYRSRNIQLRAVCSSRQINWLGKEARLFSVMSLDKPEVMIDINNKQTKIRNILFKTIEIMGRGDCDDQNQRVLGMLLNFYDADCLALIMPSIEDGEDICEVHRESAGTMARLLQERVQRGMADFFDDTFEDGGLKYVKDIAEFKNRNRQVYEELVELRIWSAMTMFLQYQGKFCGKLLLLNPRKNIEQKLLLQIMSKLLASQVMTGREEARRQFELKHDLLTGLLKRNGMAQMEDIWHLEDNHAVGVVFIDIVNLTEINIRYGYTKGNEYICMAADIMKQVFSGYRVFRYEKDQMFALCTDVQQNMFDIMVETARESLEELPFGTALGYSWGNGQTLMDLLAEAKEIMDKDKERQKQGDNLAKKERDKGSREVEEFLRKGNFLVYLQPKMNIRTMKLIGAEALIRYKDEKRGVLGPALFIPLLEQLDLINLVDMFVLEEVLKFQKRRIERKLETVPISVNISKRTLTCKNFIDSVRALVEQYDIPMDLIEMEITETIGDLDHAFVAKIANSLHAMGFLLSMDDFGTKYSNLAMLSSFDFQIAKIDRSIVLGLTSNPKSMIVLKHLTAMIKELGIQCIVEGVETEEELELIMETDCDLVQGYYFSHPIPQSEFEEKYM